jgi:hypothetical protein
MKASDTAAIEHYPPTSPKFHSATSPTCQNHSGLQDDEDSRPLLEAAARFDDSDEDIAAENQYVTRLYETDDRKTKFTILLVGCAAISGLLFGEGQLITCFSRLTSQDTILGSSLVLLWSLDQIWDIPLKMSRR